MGIIAVVVGAVFIWRDTVKAALGCVSDWLGMTAADWGLAGSLLLVVPPVHDLYLRFRREDAERQASGSLAPLATAIAKGWERKRNALSFFDILCVGLGALCLATSFFLS